jgi:hypothetical protein
MSDVQLARAGYVLPKPQTKIHNGTAAAVAATVKGD